MAEREQPAVLVLAGLDPSGGAGLLADAEAVREAGARPLCVATALTVQTTKRARDWKPVPVELVLEQARALLEEEPVAAIKAGMLGTSAMARALAELQPKLPLVIDPVLRASSGASLFEGEPRELLIRGSIVTPNLAEAQRLLGLPALPASAEAMAGAARELVRLGAKAALIKGGHLSGEAIDVLFDGAEVHELRGARLANDRRGTGCRLASALAARLALGDDLLSAARAAKELVRRYLG
jgi:hydroxymethylpyrimidine/phosphomethylpyrimidine kinase